MPPSENINDNSISISAQIEERGLTINVKSRALASVDRLIGNFVDIPGNYFELLNKRFENQKIAETSILQVEIAAAREKLSLHDQCGDRLLTNILSKEARRQKNKQEIGMQALALIDEATTAEEAASSEKIADDWLNIFEKYAEDASSERMRDLWARVLAGEIRQPKSFSLTTLRFLAEIDIEAAKKFEKIVEDRITSKYLPKKDLKGSDLLDYLFLEEVGLLQGVNDHLGLPLRTNEDGYVYFSLEEHLLIRMKPKAGEFRVQFIRLTRTAQEILKILPACDYRAGAKILCEQIKSKIEEAILFRRRHAREEFMAVEKLL